MAVSSQAVADLQARFQELQARLDTTTKDLSLLTLVPNWAGTEKPGSLHEFLSAVEKMAEMGNWLDKDKVRIATMKLEDAARVFVEAAPEIRGREVSWADFKRPSSNGSDIPELITSTICSWCQFVRKLERVCYHSQTA
jgi:hypothetical protein